MRETTQSEDKRSGRKCCSTCQSGYFPASTWRRSWRSRLSPCSLEDHDEADFHAKACYWSSTLQQFLPEVPYPMVRAHGGMVLQELQPVGNTRSGTIRERLCLVGGTPTLEQGRSLKRKQQQKVTVVNRFPIPPVPLRVGKMWENED